MCDCWPNPWIICSGSPNDHVNKYPYIHECQAWLYVTVRGREGRNFTFMFSWIHLKLHLLCHMGQDHKLDVLIDTKDKIDRNSQFFDPQHERTFLLFYLGPCHGYSPNDAISSTCPSSQIPVSNLPLCNHGPYSSRRFSQELLLTNFLTS